MSSSADSPRFASFACDRCHGRKVKCDKYDPCKACIAAKTVCSRRRRESMTRKMKATEKVRLLEEELYHLKSLNESQAKLTENSKNRPRSEQEPHDTLINSSVFSEFEACDQWNHRPLSDGSRNGIDGESQHRATECSIGVINTPSQMHDGQRREACGKLLAALNESDELSSLESWSAASRAHPGGDGEIYDLCPGDILQILATPLANAPIYNPIARGLQAYCQMAGKVLLEENIQGTSVKVYCKIALNFQAGMILSQTRGKLRQCGISNAKVEHIAAQKFRDVLSKLDHITFRTPPSYSMLLAQCIGTVILLYFGNLPEAWIMLVAATRTLLAMSYDKGNIEHKENGILLGLEKEAVASIIWCRQLDISMSILLRQKPLLEHDPRLSKSLESVLYMHYDGAAIHHRNLVLFAVQLTHVQGQIALLAQDSTRSIPWGEIEGLQQEIKSIQVKMQDWDSNMPVDIYEQLMFEIKYLKFRCHASESILFQLCADISASKQLLRQAVECARQTFRDFQDLIEQSEGVEMMGIVWDPLLYSISPLCILLYNIVISGSQDDRNLIANLAVFIREHTLATIPDNPLVVRIHNLYETVCHICDQMLLHVCDVPRAASSRTESFPTNHTARRRNFMHFDHIFDPGTKSTPSSSTNGFRPIASRNTNEGEQTDEGDEGRENTEDILLKLLHYRTKLGWRC